MSVNVVLVLNAGSGSLKIDVIGPGDEHLAGHEIMADPTSDDTKSQLTDFLDHCPDVEAVGHRMVHGGPDLHEPTVVDDAVRSLLDEAATLAPLHLPPALGLLDACRRALPDVPHVACFDTAFHAGMPAVSTTYAVPARWRTEFGLRRYGFHGLSYAYVLDRAGQLLGRDTGALNLVLTHLGGGASVCAVSEGRSRWTSMGFTPLEGMAMAKRSGSVDPGMLLWLQTQHGLSADQLSTALEHESGLRGLSGGRSDDTRELVAAAAAGDQDAALAMDVFILRACQEIAAAAVTLPRLDGLVFTGEIGVDQPEVRQGISAGLGLLGLPATLDPAQDGDRRISADEELPVLLIHPREDLQISRETRRALA